MFTKSVQPKSSFASGALAGFLAALFNISASGLILAAIFTACGKKGSPKPPEFFAPDTVEFFQASGSVDGVTLQWQEPSKKANGDDLDNLSYFIVKKRLYEGEDSDSFEEIATIAAVKDEPVLDASGSTSTPDKKKKPGFAGMNKQKSEPAKKAKQYSYVDRNVQPGKKYEYVVTAENDESVEGATSTTIRITFVGDASIIERR